MQLYTSASNCKGVGNVPGSHSVKAVAFLMSVASQSAVPSMLISVEKTGKNQLQPGQASMGYAPVLSHHSLLRNPLTKTDQYAGELLGRRNQLLVLLFSGHFILTAALM